MSLTSTTPDWPIKPLSTVIVEMRGGAPLKPNDFTKDGVKVLPKGAVGRTGWLDVTEKDLQYCSHDYANAHRTNQIDEQYTVVVLRDLVPSGPSIGLIVRIRDPERWLLAQGVYGFKLNDELDPSYLSQLSNTQWYRKLMNQIMVGSTQVHITNTAFKAASVPMPPLAEQRAIATTLSDVDALIAGLERLIAKKRDIKQAAMQQLLTGQTRLPGFSGEWDYFRVAELEKLGLLRLGRGNVISKKDIDATPGDCPIYSSSVKNDGEFGRYGNFMFDEELITWSVDGGGNFFYRSKHRFSVTNVCGYMRADSMRLNYRYLAAQLQFEHGKKTFDYQSKAHPSVVRAEYLIPIPKIEEQTAIAIVLSNMEADLATLESRLIKTRAIKQGMMQELLTGRTRLI
ncbi:MAG TPA: restriction endonuclease subunit S [Aquabacterium sp.]|uniref:restriction endonuclease subunit S n=1 Tax=Aquabacterium sp. TaxID=1872578 RepID=UPI002E34DA65|nr:restriction endonuclease subunit S [Aquabacterium sp.]HEX5355777.1 restriction endonuclease subunit S [Aquabacterium sp.]